MVGTLRLRRGLRDRDLYDRYIDICTSVAKAVRAQSI